MDLRESLMTLSSANGPTGREAAAAAVAGAMLEPYVTGVSGDQIGNLIGIRASGKFGAPRVLIDAHIDEICLYVTGSEDGFLTFAPGGGVDPRLLPDAEVEILCEPPLRGVITCLPPHIMTAEEQDKPFDIEKLRIDAALTKEQAEQLPIGTPVVWSVKPFAMGEDLVCGKALDDRAGLLVLIRAMELLKDEQLSCDVVVLGSVQEESTMLGAKGGAFSMMPHAAVVVDVTFADQPDCDKESTVPLGGGPAITICPMLSQPLTSKLRKICEEKGIDYNLEISTGHPGTNAAATQISREGVPTVMISVPLRYMHTPREVVSLSDIEQSAKLLAEFLLTFGEEDLK